MNADDGEDVRIFFRQLDRAPAALDRGADRDDPRDAGLGRAPQHIIEVRREIRVIEVGVGFDEHCRVAELRVESSCRSALRFGSLQLCNLNSATLHHHSITVLAQVRPPPKTTMST